MKDLNDLKFVTLQLAAFKDKMYEDDVSYHMYFDADQSVIFFYLCDSVNHYSLVTQKNEFRSFSSLSSVFKALPICSSEKIDFCFESSER